MVSRKFINKAKGRFLLFLVILVVTISIIYFYFVFVQENFKNVQWAEKRCVSELTSVKSQLHIVTEYKNRIDKMLSDSQKAHEADKDKFKDVMESFQAMKQQSAICQSQFDDLETECKKFRELYNQENRELEQLKEQHKELQLNHEQLQNTVKDQYTYIDTLKTENFKLQDTLRGQQTPVNYETNIQHFNNRSFSHQLEESDGVYKIDLKNNILHEHNQVGQRRSIEDKLEIRKLENKGNNGGGNNLPPGFAPILPILETVNSNLPKPNIVQESNENIKDVHVLKANKGNDQQIMNDPDINVANVLDSNANVHDIDNIEGNKVDMKELNVVEQNQIAEEDDDDGDEYPV